MKYSRRQFLQNALAAGASLHLAGSVYGMQSSQPQTGARPNILFIAVDDLKPMLGCYGDPIAISPNMDRIAARGTTFLNNHCQYPVCGPTRASLMTSLMPEVTGVIGFKKMRAIIPDVLTLPQHFKNHKYETAATGKINDPRCVDGGRTSDDEPSWSIPFKTTNPVGRYKDETKASCQAPIGKDAALDDTRICEDGLELMRQLAKGDKPFFLGVGFKKPHLPFIAPKKYWDLYDRNDLKIHPFQKKSKNAVKYTWHDSKELRGHSDIPDQGDIPIEKQLEVIHGYYACISFIDAQVGRLLDELEKLGIADNTIIMLWGDHGWHLGDHGLWGKHTNLEQASRSPMIIASPLHGKKNSQTKSPTAFLDIFPTLCELASLPVHDQLQGKSLKPLMTNPASEVRKGAITLFRRGGATGYAYRNKRYRYIEWVEKTGTVGRELYDYDKDPMETVNLAAKEHYSSLVAELASSLRKEGVGCLLLKKAGD